MDVASFIAYVIVITVSGALSPGPLTMATMIHGARGGLKEGLNCALGHMIVELPVVLFIWLGLLSLVNPVVKQVLELIGGLALIGFGASQLRENLRFRYSSQVDKISAGRSPLLTGILLSGLNPYFILWWLSIGSALVYEAINLGVIQGLTVMYLAHVWVDYAWLGLLAHLSGCGRKIIGLKIYSYILAAFSLALIALGILWIFSAVAA